MSEPITITTDVPPHICVELLNVIELESESDGRFLDELERQVEEGRITEADAGRTIDDFPESSREELLSYCRDNCSPSHCAMKGFGVELVGVDPTSLGEEDRNKLSFFLAVDTTRAAGKVSMGIPLL